MQGRGEGYRMSNADVIREVLLKFTEPHIAIGETNHDKEAYNNLLTICRIHDYCYDLIRENAELKGNEYSIVKAREKAIKHISESIVYMRDLMDDLKAESECKDYMPYQHIQHIEAPFNTIRGTFDAEKGILTVEPPHKAESEENSL